MARSAHAKILRAAKQRKERRARASHAKKASEQRSISKLGRAYEKTSPANRESFVIALDFLQLTFTALGSIEYLRKAIEAFFNKMVFLGILSCLACLVLFRVSLFLYGKFEVDAKKSKDLEKKFSGYIPSMLFALTLVVAMITWIRQGDPKLEKIDELYLHVSGIVVTFFVGTFFFVQKKHSSKMPDARSKDNASTLKTDVIE